MRIALTGATGFIGTYLIQYLVLTGHEPIALGRNKSKLQDLSDTYKIPVCECDVHSPEKVWRFNIGRLDGLIHLAWGELDNYNSLGHIERELPAHCRFLNSVIKRGVKRVVVAGSCLEYGLQNGGLSENMITNPVTSYGIAKDTLRKYLSILQNKSTFSLTWLRYFYMHGKGQRTASILSQLDSAIHSGEVAFNMSGGMQIRDYLPVEQVAKVTAWLATHPCADGVYNVCSGKPISIRDLVEKRKHEQNSNIALNLGYYPYPDYEPMAFWGDNTKINHLMDTN